MSEAVAPLMRALASISISRVEADSAEQMVSRMDSYDAVPVVFTGACCDWPIFGADQTTFDSVLGTILGSLGPSARLRMCSMQYKGIGSRKLEVELSEASAETLRDVKWSSNEAASDGFPPLVYIQQRGLPLELPELVLPDSGLAGLCRLIRRPSCLRDVYLRETNLWLGQCVTSRIHFDAADNLHVVVAGVKRVRLWPATELWRMYPTIDLHRREVSAERDSDSDADGNESKPLARSRVDSSLWPDHAKYPDFGHVPVYETLLKAGEALFIPEGWWHEFCTPEPAVSFNFWYSLAADRRAKSAMRPTMLALRSARYYLKGRTAPLAQTARRGERDKRAVESGRVDEERALHGTADSEADERPAKR